MNVPDHGLQRHLEFGAMDREEGSGLAYSRFVALALGASAHQYPHSLPGVHGYIDYGLVIALCLQATSRMVEYCGPNFIH